MSSDVDERGMGDDGPDAAGVVVSENPATLEINDEIPETDADGVAAAVERARAAQAAWATRAPEARLEVLDTFRDLLLDRKQDIARTVSRETGKPVGEALASDIGPVLSAISFVIDEGPSILEEPLSTGPLESTGESVIVREPVGVVGMITPWNYPFGIPGSDAVPALFAGNSVVLKPAEETTLTALLLADLLDEAGLPEDVFTVVPGRGRVTGQALAEAAVDHLSFTGSAEVGHELEAACASRGVSTCLELGGSDPAIVLEDANLDLTADGIVWARYTNAGQACGAVKRVYADESIEPDLRERIVDRVEALRVGTGESGPIDVGPLIDESAVDAIDSQVQRSVEMGAEVLTGGTPLDDLPGHFYAPTVLTDVTHEMPVVTEETFGPVLPIMPVGDEDEAVERANDSRYGLTASVWTRDTDRGRRLAERLEAGTVTVNDHLYTFGLHGTPWGGVKDSGGDWSHGRWGIENVTTSTHIHVASGETFPSSGRFENLWWFPYPESFPTLMDETMDLLHAPGRVGKLRKVPSVLLTAIRDR